MRRNCLDAHIRVLGGDKTEAAGERAARHLLDDGQLPTAVVASSDQCAIGVLAGLARPGVAVPGRVSVAATTTRSPG
ncbi:substrate-binding domain-containing protein [Streptomyces sp. NPDC057616]|uniref:substrate-binding domain-containing protein n=1 Tax=Streptomyces sp. NPDC057616 TaxID=3346183 RepID=UPI0036B49BBC